MSWLEKSPMDLRVEFVSLACVEGANISALCRRFSISRKTGYKWLGRNVAGEDWRDRSRRPRRSPKATAAEVSEAVVTLRGKHPTWGGRKLRRRLQDMGAATVPAASTITTILHRHEMIAAAEAVKHTAFQRFEHSHPNALWQMDFKGHFAHGAGRCHPLTVLDDHSRFSPCLAACEDERAETVRARLTETFRIYGMPERMNMDNGSPWGGKGQEHAHTILTVWLMRLGIRCSHSRPYHPQTNGKDERFHRTLKADVIQGTLFQDRAQCQRHFDRFRQVYNCERPHEAIAMTVPASRYRISPHPFPEQLPELVYPATDEVRRVNKNGQISFHGRIITISSAFQSQSVAFRPTLTDGVWDIRFASSKITQIDLRNQPGQT
jgi:transposase InsO family protein